MQFSLISPPPAPARILAAFQGCYPGAVAAFRRQRIDYQFQPGPAGLPNESTLVLWRQVPGYRYRLGVRPSGEVLSATGQVLRPEELAQLVEELGGRWHRSAQRAEDRAQRVLIEMAMQVCFMLTLILGLFAVLSIVQDSDSLTEALELGGLAVVFCITGFICRKHH